MYKHLRHNELAERRVCSTQYLEGSKHVHVLAKVILGKLRRVKEGRKAVADDEPMPL